ncbi:MAG TPA: substrate-binding domain-containing protein [Nocardia sp.]|uniref:sugar ABC transporter substrate-binding protein n=1 Tax=Nocardia TaxID=1817 RepID=UPI002458971F|nr:MULTISPECIES: substrate-binding domain-containing protein [Nocardia]HLS77552.1 substrate-binding domain-containing protein [Nocardia sp.]
MKPTTRAAAGALLLGAALAMTACTAATDAGSGDTVERTLSAAARECVDKADTRLAAAMTDVEAVVPTAPLDLAALRGKTVWFITVTMNQFSVDMSDGVEEAVEAAGMELVRYDGQGMTNRFNEGIEQAIAQQAAGIILVGIDPAVVSSALAKAAAAGIPVQNTLNTDAAAPVPTGMYGNLTSDYTADGVAAADWMLSDSGCAAEVAILSSSSVAVWENTANGAKAQIEAECPDCTVTVLDVDVANVATAVGSKLQSELQRNPGIDYVFPVWDSAVTYVDPVLAAANSKAKVLARDGLEANLKAIAAGGNQDMTVAMPPTGWIGWLAVDDLARAITGAPAPGYVIPTRVVDSSNVADASAEEIFPNFVDYQAAFQAAWGANQ